MNLRKYKTIKITFSKKTDSKTHQYHICKESLTQKSLKNKNERKDEY